MTSTSAIDATTTAPDSRERRNSASSDASGSSASISPIEYEEQPTTEGRSPNGPEGRTVRKGKDYRPESTFWRKNKRDMNHNEFICSLAVCPTEVHLIKPETIDRGPVPVKWVLPEQLWILSRGLAPMALQAASNYLFPNHPWPAGVAYLVYFLWFTFGTALGVVHRLDYYCQRFGVLDEKNFGRDRTPDQAVGGLAKGILLYMLLRTAMPFYFYYNKNVEPITDFTWTYPLRLMAWLLTLDYFFYCYHRASHQVDSLWFIHQMHHTTKHPTAILAILAGDYQECLEIALCPLAATYLVPMSFSELYMTLVVTLYVEMLGHSGVRAHWAHPALGWLKYFNMELAVEDHDLHHRFGKSGLNFGKQSRFWDQIFGTSAERIETYGM